MGDRRRRWQRSWMVGLGSVALVLAAAAMPTSSAAQEGGTVPNGTAKATAVLGGVRPGVGGLDLGMKTGISVADVTNQLAQAQAQSVDLGLVGTSLTAESCGDDGRVDPEDLPQPARVDNTEGDAAESKSEAPLGPLSGFDLAAEATEVPSSSARSQGAAFEFPDLLEIGGGNSVARTEVLPGAGREARATVDASIDLAGVLQLEGMRWRALHRTGAERVVEGSFDVGSAAVGGVPVPMDELQPAQEAINEALAASGVRVELPRVEKLTEPTDLVRVTPLRIEIRDSELGATALGPALNATREQREQLFQQIGEAVCDLKGFLLVADVGIAIGAGSGFLTFDIGGVEALSGDFEVGEQIGIIEPVAPVDPPAPVSEPGPASGPSPAGSPSSSAAPSTDPGETAASTAPAASRGPLERVCESVHPFSWPPCSRGAAPAAGLLGLLATGTMVGLDVRRQRLADPGPSGDPAEVTSG